MALFEKVASFNEHQTGLANQTRKKLNLSVNNRRKTLHLNV